MSFFHHRSRALLFQGEEIVSQSVSNADENEDTMNDVSEGELEDDDDESETEMVSRCFFVSSRISDFLGHDKVEGCYYFFHPAQIMQNTNG